MKKSHFLILVLVAFGVAFVVYNRFFSKPRVIATTDPDYKMVKAKSKKEPWFYLEDLKTLCMANANTEFSFEPNQFLSRDVKVTKVGTNTFVLLQSSGDQPKPGERTSECAPENKKVWVSCMDYAFTDVPQGASTFTRECLEAK